MQRRFFIAIVFGLILLVLVAPGLAHESRDVGPHIVVFGWREEPAATFTRNGPEAFIFERTADGERGDAVADAELTVEVSFGPETLTVPLRPAFGDPGHYIADMTPTRPGDYEFHLTGTAGDQEIDEVFTSADGGFSSVEPVADFQFPQPEPNPFDLLAEIEALRAEIADLREQIEALQG